MRQLDELLDEILQVRHEEADEAEEQGEVEVEETAEEAAHPAEPPQPLEEEWEDSAETWAEPEGEWEAPQPDREAAVWTAAAVETPVEIPQVEEHSTEAYADLQPHVDEPPAEEGPPVEEALADSWDGTLDVAESGWEEDTASSADESPAYDWSRVEAATPVFPEAPPAPEPEAPPAPAPAIVSEAFSDMRTAETRTGPEPEPSAWVDVSASTFSPVREPAAAPVEVPAPVVVPAPARFRRRGSRSERPTHRRALRAVGVVGLVLAVAAASLWTITVLRGGPAPRPAPPAARGLNQHVLVWSVWDEKPRGPAFVSVLATGGGLDPVLLAIPPKTVVSVPGRGYESVGDTASVGQPDAVAGAVENILGIRVDAATGMPLASLAPIVDRIGGIDVEDPEDFGVQDPRLNGQQTVEYLRAREAGAGEAGDDTRFIRWLEVTTAIVTKAYEKPEILQEIPEAHRAAFAATGSGRTQALDLPVQAIGAGLARPDGEEVARLVRELFLTSAETGRVVRIVVMNGNGRPGTGQMVARVLVPSGFRLVSSLNAPKFNVATTRIVAASEEFLPEAYLAQRLLGVGEVYVVDQESLVADLSIVVGKDFLRR
ncbi:MAG: LytR C-terminal domain-containing protein [Actinomycetota bacterium]